MRFAGEHTSLLPFDVIKIYPSGHSERICPMCRQPFEHGDKVIVFGESAYNKEVGATARVDDVLFNTSITSAHFDVDHVEIVHIVSPHGKKSCLEEYVALFLNALAEAGKDDAVSTPSSESPSPP